MNQDIRIELTNLKNAIGIWSNLKIKKNLDRIINNLNQKRRLIDCVSNGRIEVEADNDGAITIYEVL